MIMYIEIARINKEDPTGWTVQPAHTITLHSPLVVVNLLPYELLWEMKSIAQSGLVKPGKSTSIHTVDLSDCCSSDGLQIAFRTENFVHSSDLVVSVPPQHNSTARLRLYDSANRLLVLQVKLFQHISLVYKESCFQEFDIFRLRSVRRPVVPSSCPFRLLTGW